MANLGNSRNDSRKAKLPKNEAKKQEQLVIREFAKNNGISIKVAKIMFEED